MIINYRQREDTYFIHIRDFVQMTRGLDKKSFSHDDLMEHRHVLVPQRLKRVAYDYDVTELILQLKTNYGEEKL